MPQCSPWAERRSAMALELDCSGSLRGEPAQGVSQLACWSRQSPATAIFSAPPARQVAPTAASRTATIWSVLQQGCDAESGCGTHRRRLAEVG